MMPTDEEIGALGRSFFRYGLVNLRDKQESENKRNVWTKATADCYDGLHADCRSKTGWTWCICPCHESLKVWREAIQILRSPRSEGG